MPMDSETMDFLKRLQDTLDANTRKLDANTQKLTEINSAVQELRKKQSEVPMLKANVETMKKQMLAKTVVFSGFEDKEDEDYSQTEAKIQSMAKDLSLN